MSGAARGRAEQQLFARPGLVALVTAVLAAITAGVLAGHATLIPVQRLDDAWLRLMVSGRSASITAAARLFNVIGLVYVDAARTDRHRGPARPCGVAGGICPPSLRPW